MLWKADGNELKPDYLGPLIPDRVLFEYEGPRSFLTRDSDGELLFAHQCGEVENTWRYAVVPFSDRLVEALEAGRLDLRTALDQPRLWLVDIGSGGLPTQCVRSDLLSIPETCLPRSGVMLHPELEPLLSVRSTGRHVEMGKATLGVLRAALDNARGSLKTLAEFATGEVRKRGQPSAKTRRYYDLPALLLAGSVRVVVLPENDPQRQPFDFDEIWKRMETILHRGLEAVAATSDAVPKAVEEDDELRAALQAVYFLSPPAYGPVNATEISGRLAPRRKDGMPITVTRTMRASIQKRLQVETENQPELVVDEGFVSELDREEATCLLRDSQGITIRKLSFEEEFFDDIKSAFDSQSQLRVVAEILPPTDAAAILAVVASRLVGGAGSDQ